MIELLLCPPLYLLREILRQGTGAGKNDSDFIEVIQQKRDTASYYGRGGRSNAYMLFSVQN